MTWTKSNGTIAARIYERLRRRGLGTTRWWPHQRREGYLQGVNETLRALKEDLGDSYEAWVIFRLESEARR